MKQAKATIKIIDRISQPIFWALFVSVVCFSTVYIYFIQKAVRNVVISDKYREEMASLNSKLSESEFHYINAVERVTLDTAHELGFNSAVDKTTFVTREHMGQSVAFR